MSEQAAEHDISVMHRGGLVLARAGWLGMTLLILILVIAGIPTHFARFQTVCYLATDVCIESGLLTPEMVRSLQQFGLSPFFWAAYILALNSLSLLVWYSVAAIIFARKSDNRMALFVAFFLVSFGAGIAASDLLNALTNDPIWWLLVQSLGFLGNACVIFFAYLFPNGRFAPRWTCWLAFGWIAVFVPAYFFPDSPLNYQNRSEFIEMIIFVGFLGSCVAAQVYRYRRVSNPMQRQQTKWVVFGVAAAVAGFLGLILPSTFNPAIENTFSALVIAHAGIHGSLMLIPISIGVAILRYRLYDIDVIIRRTLVYSLLTITLGLVYVGCILLSRTLVAPLTGGSELAIVASTLGIAALFTPLRRRIQTLIDKRFYRRKYDAAKVLASFGVAARDEIDLERLTGEMLRVVDETVQPEFVGLWLREPDTDKQRGAM